MKLMKAVFVMLLVLALATPALAELTLNGYYRVQGTAENAGSASTWNKFALEKDAPSDTFVDQRLRLKLTNAFNDKVKLVYFGEVDTPWGMPSKGSIGGGGQQGADGVNFETKQAYLDFKMSSWNFIVGLQNMGDNVSDIVIDNDVAGITAKTKFGALDLTLRYAKLYENDRSTWDDVDFYGVQTGFTFSDKAKLGFDVLYFDNNTNYTAATTAVPAFFTIPDINVPAGWTYTPAVAAKAAAGGNVEQFYYSVNGDFNFGDANLTGWVLYGTEDKEKDPTTSSDDTDGKNWAASAQVETKLGNGKISLRGIYYADANDAEDNVFTDDHGTGFQFYQEGLMLFLTDIYYNNGIQGGLYKDAAHNGYGLTALTLKGSVGLSDGYYVKYAAGYFAAADDQGFAATAKKGKSMGTEFDLMFGKKFSEKVDLSLRGAYAFLGNFYDATNSNNDPDNPWKAVAMLNVGF